jgi:hypothetical protein
MARKTKSGLIVPDSMGLDYMPPITRPSNYTPERIDTPEGSGVIGIQGKTLHPQQFATMVQNIEHGVLTASDEDLEAGKSWYPRAQEIAHEVGGGDIRKGAGILAVTSPQNSWGENVRMAREIGRTGTTKGFITGDTIRRANEIREGRDPAELLPEKLKTGHFFRNIHDPSDRSSVTIDRHAHDASINERWGSRDRGLGTLGRYGTFVNAHMAATQRLNTISGLEDLNAGQTQAVNWVRWRNMHGITD